MTLTLSTRRDAFKDASHTTELAGYPLPDKDWYRHRNNNGEYAAVTFTKEKSIQGFNLTCSKYYILRDALVPLLHKDDIYKKRFNDANVKHDDLWPIFVTICEHDLVQHPTHIGWKHDMLFRWFKTTAETFPFLPADHWKWGRSDLSPKKGSPYMLYKLVSIRFEDEGGKVAIVRLVDLADDAVRPVMGNRIDMNPSDSSFDRLVKILLDNESINYQKGSKIKFLHLLRGNVYVAIETDKQLSYAIKQLRIRGTSKIEMRVVGVDVEDE
ncbi:uncharacterized protein K460DRAFT_378880 [Cucurbitaria berberidis CBS 394.84]|uniref:Uncharacterized protein n=1 Tax=Cucurbitaria berberidis CBS 394.84 TaxID=1168544 RepID=A0A9P4GDB2_9PLEO|nr:uncharacterized protein K460DRAFT_378880 [Cucurbitaria berberidis CBS 394.84]KAF1843823.1 hypothetical protein K460DRAFT_378880 [Cucurbitaria berberidis CBS 394.84]